MAKYIKTNQDGDSSATTTTIYSICANRSRGREREISKRIGRKIPLLFLYKIEQTSNYNIQQNQVFQMESSISPLHYWYIFLPHKELEARYL